MRIDHGDYEIDDDPARVDGDAAFAFLSTEAYWGTWRTRKDLDAQLDEAWRLVGAYDRDTGAMVGFARAVSDGVSITYLADVYVLGEARGSGLGVALVDVMIERGPGRDLRWMLHTRDAHGLYQRFGFVPPTDRYLERPERHRAVSPEG
ncbi:MAG TPA: GNAT family N-acetyltransferase [Pseudonocardiaceae bacterium]|nr:GNAT family N-acetyltransferase [Pseudonocardiaceae bacterium]